MTARKRVNRRFRNATPMLARVFELQERGVFHVHVALAYGTPQQRAEAKLYVAAVRDLAKEAGFGQSLRRSPPRAGRRVATYLSKALVETVAHPLAPASLVYVSNGLSQRTGCTVRALRIARYIAFVRRQTIALCARIRRFDLIPPLILGLGQIPYQGASP